MDFLKFVLAIITIVVGAVVSVMLLQQGLSSLKGDRNEILKDARVAVIQQPSV